MGNALLYEHLMRAAYDVDRKGNADADLYRDWEVEIRGLELQKKAIKNKEMPIDNRSVEELEYQVRKGAAAIRENISSAISNILRTPRPSAIEKQLRELKSELKYDLYDKEKIDAIIDRTWSLFRELKLPQT